MGMVLGRFPLDRFHGKRRNVACTAAQQMRELLLSPKLS
jgi:hypothetical protein